MAVRQYEWVPAARSGSRLLEEDGNAYRVCGCVDVLTVGEEEVELLDYKTGEPHPEYRAQVELYALLFERDAKVNPSRRRATRLALVYEQGAVDEWSAPTQEELGRLANALLQQCRSAFELTALMPPPARVGEHCGWCDARPLCSDYWADPLGAKITQSRARVDLQATIVGGSRDKSDVAVKVDEASGRLLVSPVSREGWNNVRIGDVVRVTGARRVSAPPDDAQPDGPSGDVYEVDTYSEAVCTRSDASI